MRLLLFMPLASGLALVLLWCAISRAISSLHMPGAGPVYTVATVRANLQQDRGRPGLVGRPILS